MRKHIGTGVILLVFLVMLFLWESAGAENEELRFFFSRPSEIGAALVNAFQRGAAVDDLVATTVALLLGTSVGLLGASAVAFVGLQLRALAGTLQVMAAVLAALPILAIAPMFLIWFGVGISLKVAIAGLLSGLVFVQVILRGDALVPEELREFCEANGVKRSRFIAKVLMPSTIKALLDAFPSAVNAAFLGVFVGEFIAANVGVGYRILQVGRTYQIDAVIAYACLTIAMLLVLQGFVHLIGSGGLRYAQEQSVDGIVRRAS